MRPSADRHSPDDTADRLTSSAGSGFAEAYRVPWYRLYVLRLSLVTGQPSGILYRSAASVGSYDVGLVPVLSADGQAQQWFLVLDPEQFGWISGGKLVPLPIKASAGLLAIGW